MVSSGLDLSGQLPTKRLKPRHSAVQCLRKQWDVLGAIAAVKTLYCKGQCGFNVFDLRQHAFSALVPGGAALGPGGQDVRHC